MKIDLLIQPDQDCELLEQTLRKAAEKVNIVLELKRTNNFKEFSQLAINPSQTPIVIINGQVEFAGRLPEMNSLQKRLFELDKMGGPPF